MISELQSLGEGALGEGLEPLFDALLEGIIVRDTGRRVIACNRMARQILRVPPGASCANVNHALALEFVREDGSPLPACDHPVMRTLRSGEAQRGVVLGVVHAPEDVTWINANCQPLRDGDGKLCAVVTSFADITPIKRAQEALLASERRNRTLAEAIAQAGCSVVITDRDGRIEYVNPACCLAYGYAASELVGAKPSIFKSGETARETYESLWQTIRSGRIWRGELSNRSRDGRLIREAVSISPVRDERGEVRHFVALKEDITQLRDEERRRHGLFERVARLERMELVATLAGGIAHDFNNVLVAILGYSELAEASLRADGRLPRVTRYVEEIRIAGNRARDLIQQLLKFSRSGAVQPRRTRLDDAAREVVGLLRATLPDTIAVFCDVDRRLPPLSIEPAHAHQILMNLLVNARDALGGRGVIRVSARRTEVATCICESCRREFGGAHVAIEIADDGCGIAAELRQRVFEPFFTTKDVGRGTGMGLPVVHGMAHLYDGHLTVESAPGRGTMVRVLLPTALFLPPDA